MSEPPSKNRSRGRAVRWAAPLFILSLAGAFNTRMRDDTDLAVLFSGSLLFESASRKQIYMKPVVDFRLPAIGRVYYPQPVRSELHERQALERVQRASGVIRLRDRNDVIKSEIWQIDGRNFANYDLLPLRRWVLAPYVYGDRPKVARFKWKPSGDWVDIQLPATKGPAPELQPASTIIGDYRIRLKPLPLVATWQKVDYALTVTGGKPGEMVHLRLWSPTRPAYADDMPRLVLGHEAGLVHLSGFEDEELGVEIGPCEVSDVSIRVKKVGTSVDGIAENGLTLFRYREKEGLSLIQSEIWIEIEGSTGLLGKPGSREVVVPYVGSAGPSLPLDVGKLKDRQILKGRLYRYMPTKSGTVKLKLPKGPTSYVDL